jgi:hypothetical protein
LWLENSPTFGLRYTITEMCTFKAYKCDEEHII